MRLYKVDTEAWTVREVEGESWPGNDSDGDTCYENTHFVDEAEAWAKLRAEVETGVSLAGRAVAQAKAALAAAEKEAGRMAEAFAVVCDRFRERAR